MAVTMAATSATLLHTCSSCEPNLQKENEESNHGTYVAPADFSNFKIFAGNGNIELASEVATRLNTQLGRALVGQFSDGETRVQIHDNVRGKDVFIIQSTGSPPSETLMELLLLISTLRRASAERIVAIIPYFSYARQSDASAGRSTIPGADVALMLEAVGVDQVVTVDFHRAQAEGFFSCTVPVENLELASTATPYFLNQRLVNPVIISPCGHTVHRAKKFREHLLNIGIDASLALMSVENETGFVDPDEAHHSTLVAGLRLVGDVKDCDVIIVDDMIDSASRMTKAAACCKANGANRVFAFATHGLFTGNAIKKIDNSHLTEVIVFNTLPLSQTKWSPKIRQLSCGALLAEVITNIYNNEDLCNMK